MNHKIKPQPKLIDRWKNLIALEVVSQLRGEATQKSELEDISIPPMNLKSELPMIINLLEQEAKPVKTLANIADLVREKKRLEKYCLQNLVKNEIQLKLDSLRRSKITLLKSILEINAKEYRPPDASLRAKKLASKLLDLKLEAESIVREKQLLQKNAWEQYDRESSKKNLQNLYIQITNGLKAKIEEEYYQALVVQLYLEAHQLCKIYQDWTDASLEVLKKIQKSLEETCIRQKNFQSFKNKVDIAREQKLLEVWTGHPVNFWGNTPVSWQQIESKLLENLTQSAEKLSQEFCDCLSEEVEIQLLVFER